MDAKEALKYFDFVVTLGRAYYPNSEAFKAHELAISALEKQIPKEPILDSGNRLCGECSEIIKAYESHCPFCGQAIKNDKE